LRAWRVSPAASSTPNQSPILEGDASDHHDARRGRPDDRSYGRSPLHIHNK
jgi:hypothetical protein